MQSPPNHNIAHTPQPHQYSSKAQKPLPVDTSPPLLDANIKQIQRVIGSILYYASAVDLQLQWLSAQ
jgi:hypothetical protein